MGNDKLFNKNRERTKRDLARRRANRSSYEKILIVCEGQKTEPNYFNELKDYYQLNTTHVVDIDGSCGSDPWSVYQHARKCASRAKKDNDPYDKVYCVFDKDKHTTYQKTLNAIDGIKINKVFTAIFSVPCFEYWLLLHFIYTTQPFDATGNKSAGDKTVDELKKHPLNYQKGDQGVFKKLVSKLEFAKTNAAKALQEAKANQIDNPSTVIHELVNYLQNLKNPKTNTNKQSQKIRAPKFSK